MEVNYYKKNSKGAGVKFAGMNKRVGAEALM